MPTGPTSASCASGCPPRSVAALYVDPRFADRVLAGGPRRRPPNPATRRSSPCWTRYLAAVRYAGAALGWRHDGLIVHTEEVVDPTGFPPALKRWAARTDAPDAASRRVPPVGARDGDGPPRFRGRRRRHSLGLTRRTRPARSRTTSDFRSTACLLGLDARAERPAATRAGGPGVRRGPRKPLRAAAGRRLGRDRAGRGVGKGGGGGR